MPNDFQVPTLDDSSPQSFALHLTGIFDPSASGTSQHAVILSTSVFSAGDLPRSRHERFQNFSEFWTDGNVTICKPDVHFSGIEAKVMYLAMSVKRQDVDGPSWICLWKA